MHAIHSSQYRRFAGLEPGSRPRAEPTGPAPVVGKRSWATRVRCFLAGVRRPERVAAEPQAVSIRSRSVRPVMAWGEAPPHPASAPNAESLHSRGARLLPVASLESLSASAFAARYCELSVDRSGTFVLAGRANTDRAALHVRTRLEEAFRSSLRELGIADGEWEGHWKAALGAHSGAGTRGRPVLLEHLRLLMVQVEALGQAAPGR
ncbi:hypothetical protein WG922_04880 [Ramlibacter sp. AN1015]|uniref:hypothetical protein n=1 Tax=Ramlibacter sp. AN1015 TaxID=3133428 RepID=UPI0030BFAE6E